MEGQGYIGSGPPHLGGDRETTADATVTTLTSIPLDDDTVYFVEAHVVGRRTDSADRAAYIRSAVVFREAAGGATIEGAVQTDFTRESDNTWNCTIDVSGNNARVRVTGAAGQDINWQSRLILSPLQVK